MAVRKPSTSPEMASLVKALPRVASIKKDTDAHLNKLANSWTAEPPFVQVRGLRGLDQSRAHLMAQDAPKPLLNLLLQVKGIKISQKFF